MQRMKELSILIPCFNHVCVPLVSALVRQAKSMPGLAFEVVVLDDGSDDADAVEANLAIDGMEHCRYLRLPSNTGRSAARNRLAHEAAYPLLLFLDCRHALPDGRFLARYLEAGEADVLSGGYRPVCDASHQGGNLRYRYEMAVAARKDRHSKPVDEYLHFCTPNFMVRREVMLACPFDESMHRYGYEDVLFGKRLHDLGYRIRHIDNPVLFSAFESNAEFLRKTEEAMLTLREYRHSLEGYSTLLSVCGRLRGCGLARPLASLLRPWLPLMRRSLSGNNPRVWIFQLYKLAFYLNVASEARGGVGGR